MKKLTGISGITIIVMLILIGQSATAQHKPQQPPQPPPPLPDSLQIVKMVDDLSKELLLSSAQKEKIAALHFAHFKEAKAMMEKSKKEMEKSRAAMDASRKEFEKQVTTLLTEEQKAEFEQFMKTRRPPQAPGHKEGRPEMKTDQPDQ